MPEAKEWSTVPTDRTVINVIFSNGEPTKARWNITTNEWEVKFCWQYGWVLESDIRGLFDNISHDLLLKAVRKHVTCKWASLHGGFDGSALQ